MKKILLTSVLAIATVCGLVACGGTNQSAEPIKSEPQSAQTTEEAVHVSYQFTASYDELASFGFVYDFLVNLSSDNKAEIYIYNNAGLENENCETINATWKATKVDGEDCIELNDKINPDGKYQIFATGTTYTIEQYYFTFAGSYSRKVDINGSTTITYATVDAWKEATKTRVAGLTIGKYEEGDENKGDKEQVTELVKLEVGSSTIAFNSDKSGKLNGFGGQVARDFTWDVVDGALVLTGANDDKGFSATKGADGSYTIEYKITEQYKITFENADLSAIGLTVTKVAAVTLTSGSSTIEFYADKTGKLNGYGGQVARDFTWDVVDGALVITGANDDKGFSATKGEDGKYTIEYKITEQYKITFEAADVSAILA